jgi:citrate synthase
MLRGAAASLADDCGDEEILVSARALVQDAKAKASRIVGLGHNIHAAGDPRIPVLIAQSKAHGYFGKHWRLLLAVERVINESRQKKLPINAGGGVGAIMAEMNLDPLLGRGVALIGRCAGLIAHVAEERDRPIGLELWDLILKQDPRNVLPE